MKVKNLSNDNKVKNIENTTKEFENNINLNNLNRNKNLNYLPKIYTNFAKADNTYKFNLKSNALRTNGFIVETKDLSNKSHINYIKKQEDIIKNQELKPFKILEKKMNESSTNLGNNNPEAISKSQNSYLIDKTKPNDIENPTYSHQISVSNLNEANLTYSTSNILIGLNNLGNTCYMNTSLQVILHTDIFIKQLLINPPISSTFRSTPITIALYELYKEITQKINSYNSIKNSISPTVFKKAFGSLHKNFSGYGQHDTQEFLRLLFEDISKELNRVKGVPLFKELDTTSGNKIKLNNDYDKLFKRREDSVIIDIFYGQIVNTFKCIECTHETFSYEKFLDIPLLLEKESFVGYSIDELLEEYFKIDKFKWETPCENKSCRKKSFHQKTFKIGQLPSILIISIQRYNNRYRVKNSSLVKYNFILDIERFIDKECVSSLITSNNFPRNTKYKLYAISNHTGSLDFGHYYANVNLNDTWYEFNDSHVSKVNNLNKSSTTAYVLFYKNINDE